MFLPYKIKSEEIERLTNRTLLNSRSSSCCIFYLVLIFLCYKFLIGGA